MSRIQTMAQWFLVSCCFVLAVFIEGTIHHADAHKVNIFAWVEGNMVYTQSKFAGGRKAKNAPIVVYDQNGTKLLEGQTDANGEFSFRAPGKMEMKVALLAGMGHQGEWVIPATDFADLDDEPDQAKSDLPRSSESIVKSAKEDPSGGTLETLADSPCLRREEIRQLFDEALDRRLKPISSAVHQLNNPDHAPSISEIAGGIGYIFGLVGVASYVHIRRKQKEDILR